MLRARTLEDMTTCYFKAVGVGEELCCQALNNNVKHKISKDNLLVSHEFRNIFTIATLL
jgi:hypothetical protein